MKIAVEAFMFAMLSMAVGGDDKKPDRTIEVTRKDDKVVFTEKGESKPKAVQVVVGETVRWVNHDDRPHTLCSVVKVEGKPLFRTEVIRPGEFKDVFFDVDLYRKAGGRTANFVRVKYQSDDHAEEHGELVFISAARR